MQFKGLGDRAAGPTSLNDGQTVTGGSGKFNTVEVNAKYQLQPQLVLGGSVNYTKENGIGNAKYLQFNAGADYFLSSVPTCT